MSAVPIHDGEPWVPAHLELEVREHFITLNGTSKRTDLVTATLRPRAVRATGVADIDIELTVTGLSDQVYRLLRAVIAEMTA